MANTSYEVRSVIRGYHVYKSIWTPVIRERLQMRMDKRNEYDPTAVSVVKGDQVVGYVPKKMARVFFSFLANEGTSGYCIIAGCVRRGYGLEVPCIYHLAGAPNHVSKLQRHMSNICVP